jgi:hypothetical protein
MRGNLFGLMLQVIQTITQLPIRRIWSSFSMRLEKLLNGQLCLTLSVKDGRMAAMHVKNLFVCHNLNGFCGLLTIAGPYQIRGVIGHNSVHTNMDGKQLCGDSKAFGGLHVDKVEKGKFLIVRRERTSNYTSPRRGPPNGMEVDLLRRRKKESDRSDAEQLIRSGQGVFVQGCVDPD